MTEFSDYPSQETSRRIPLLHPQFLSFHLRFLFLLPFLLSLLDFRAIFCSQISFLLGKIEATEFYFNPLGRTVFTSVRASRNEDWLGASESDKSSRFRFRGSLEIVGVSFDSTCAPASVHSWLFSDSVIPTTSWCGEVPRS